jgi:hypothetical protein
MVLLERALCQPVTIRSRAIDRIRNYSSHLSLWLSSLARDSFIWGNPASSHHCNKLEDSLDSADSSLLPDRSDIPRRSTGILGDDSSKEGRTRGRGKKAENRSLTDVPTKLLSPHKFTKIRYEGPRRDSVKIKVESSAPINVYGITADKLSDFREKGRYDLFRFAEQTELRKTLSLPSEDWYLILENDSSDPIGVHYEVFDV